MLLGRWLQGVAACIPGRSHLQLPLQCRRTAIRLPMKKGVAGWRVTMEWEWSFWIAGTRGAPFRSGSPFAEGTTTGLAHAVPSACIRPAQHMHFNSLFGNEHLSTELARFTIQGQSDMVTPSCAFAHEPQNGLLRNLRCFALCIMHSQLTSC